jgi:hypothetical protein
MKAGVVFGDDLALEKAKRSGKAYLSVCRWEKFANAFSADR